MKRREIHVYYYRLFAGLLLMYTGFIVYDLVTGEPYDRNAVSAAVCLVVLVFTKPKKK